MSPVITRHCPDGSPHVFLEDGGESPSRVSCAICDQDYGEWRAKFAPGNAEQLQKSKGNPNADPFQKTR